MSIWDGLHGFALSAAKVDICKPLSKPSVPDKGGVRGRENGLVFGILSATIALHAWQKTPRFTHVVQTPSRSRMHRPDMSQ